MFITLLTDIFSTAFEYELEKLKEDGSSTQKAMLISFTKSLDYEIEEGFRHLDLLLYAPNGKVNVFQRECWAIICKDKSQRRKISGMFARADKDNVSGSTGWIRICYHDSWKELGIKYFLLENEKHIIKFNRSLFERDFYKIIEVPKEIKKVFENGCQQIR